MQTHRRVIVVDDDQIFLRAVRRSASRRNTQIELATAGSGEIALEHVASNPVDIAIVDVYLPGVSGIEVARRVRQARPHAIVMIATAYLDDQVRAAAAGIDAARTLEKPYDLPSLIESLARPGASTPAQLIEAHIAVARNIAGRLSRLYGKLIAPDEIEALAQLGLCEAAARFDPSRAEPFVAFAERRIRGSVIDELRRVGSHTRGGRHRMLRIAEARHELELVVGGASNDELATHLGMSREEVARAQQPTRVVFAPLEGEPESPDDSPHAIAARAEELELISRARNELAPLDEAIIEMHYDQEMSFSAIAKALGISSARLVQRHARALDRLRAATDHERRNQTG